MVRYSALIFALLLVGCGSTPKAIETSGPQLGSDPKWAAYRPYLTGVIGRVQKQWERAVAEMRRKPALGSVVVVFTLDETGSVIGFDDVTNSSSDEGARACVAAIAAAAPYGVWSEEMKAILGPRQKITFTFYYQE
jgi:outer membrane biosynthesis protein TonB